MRRASVTVLIVAALLGLGACGGDDSSGDGDLASKSPQQILDEVAGALRKAEGVHIEGTSTDEDGETTLEADVDAGGDTDASIVQNGQRLAFRVVGKDAFLRADAAFWKAQGGDELAAALGGKWVHAPDLKASFGEEVARLRPAGLAECLREDHGTISVKGSEELDGEKVVVLEDEGDKPGTSPGLLYVAAEGEPLPVRVRQTGPARPGGSQGACRDGDDTTTASDIRFSDYDEAVTVDKPTGVVELPGSRG